jgi:hypothetical protein
VYNSNYELVSHIREECNGRYRLLYPDAKGYGIFEGEKIVMDKPTSALEIMMERDDLQMVKLFDFVGMNVIKHAKYHKARKILQHFITEYTFTERHFKSVKVPQTGALPSVQDCTDQFRAVYYHCCRFVPPRYTISYLQCKSFTEMFSADEVEHQVKILQNGVMSFHFFVCLQSLRVQLDLHTCFSYTSAEELDYSGQVYRRLFCNVMTGFGIDLPPTKHVLSLEMYKLSRCYFRQHFHRMPTTISELCSAAACRSEDEFHQSPGDVRRHQVTPQPPRHQCFGQLLAK